MAHPHQEHRQHKVERSRVHHMTKGYAYGGMAHSDEPQDKKLIKSMVKPSALKADGKKAKHRLDRPQRAKGGRVGKTTVNVMIAGKEQPQAIPPMGAAPMPPAAAPIPPRPPVLPPQAMAPGAMSSPGMMRKRGGRVTDGPAWKEGLKNGTPVEHDAGKNDTHLIDHERAKLTRKTGGRIEAGKGMGPKMRAGADTGEGRLEKTALQKRSD